MSEDREWMYMRYRDGRLTDEFLTGVDIFLTFASNQPLCMSGGDIKCPCRKCKNKPFHPPHVVKLHLMKNGFTPRYYIWWVHGEQETVVGDSRSMLEEIQSNPFQSMVMDIGGASLNNSEDVEEAPNPQAQELYSMLESANKELWSGCNHSQLSLVARLMSLKSEYHLSEICFDQLTELIREILPKDNCAPKDFYNTKKLLRGMGLPVEQIHSCRNHCMIFWGVDADLTQCKLCGASRYKAQSAENSRRKKPQIPHSKMYYFPLIPRLQRLYASRATAAEMRWHASSWDDGVMRHPADTLAWKHFNNTYPDFAAECRNVRLGLSTDGFQPFGQTGKQYSSWPVVITPYNLPPWMCMKDQHMFLTVVVPGPESPKEMIDVYLQPLIAELIELWDNGVTTYDVATKKNFNMRAALMLIIIRLLSPTAKIRGAATDAFQGRLEPTGYAWTLVTDVMKERYWKEMQNAFWWDETQITTAFVRARWDQVAGFAYKDFVSTVKRKAKNGQFSKIKGVLPHVLKAWMENWEKPAVKKKSEQASRNRRSGPEGPGSGPVIHHGGSRNTEKHAFDVALENDIEFEYTGIYTHMRLHRVNGVWTDPRSQKIYEAVQKRVQEERAPLPGSNEIREVTPARVEEIYREECKVDRKGCMLGKGCLSQMYAASSRGSRSSSIPVQAQNEARIQELEAKLAAQREEMERLKAQNDEMLVRDQKRARQEEEREREFAEVSKNMKKMMAFMQFSPGFDRFQS